jgi:hypothetical protein
VTSDAPELGKGIFGYRKSAVNQILADRDIMLRQAEGRVRAAESKVAELQTELVALKDRNSRMDDQLDRLRNQLDALAARESVAPPIHHEPAPIDHEPAPETTWDEPPAVSDLPPQPAPEEPFAFGEPAAEFGGLDGVDAVADEGEVEPVTYEPAVPDASIFDEPVAGHEATEEPVLQYEAPSEEPGAHQPWLDEPAQPSDAEPADDFVFGSTDYSFQEERQEPAADAEPFSFPYEPDQFGEEADDLPPVMTFDDGTSAPDQEGYAPAETPTWGMSGSETETGTSALAEAAEEAAAAAAAAEHPAPSEYQAEPEPQAEPVAPATPQPSGDEPASGGEAKRPGVSAEAIDLTNRFLTDEIQGILAAAEESSARIVERARATTQHQIAQSNRLWREVQAEVSRFATWREQVDPVIRSVKAKVESVRSQIDEVPERIRQALAPMADSISSVDADLAELASASTPPLLLTPRGLDSETEQGEDWSHEEPAGGSEQDAGAEAPGIEGDDASGHLAG